MIQLLECKSVKITAQVLNSIMWLSHLFTRYITLAHGIRDIIKAKLFVLHVDYTCMYKVNRFLIIVEDKI